MMRKLSILVIMLLVCGIILSRANNACIQYFKSVVNGIALSVNMRLGFYDTVVKSLDNGGKEIFFYMIGKGNLLSNMGEYLKAFHQYKITFDKINNYIDRNKVDLSLDKCEVMLQMSKMSMNLEMYEEGTYILFEMIQ